MKMSGNAVLITGGATGIGFSMAKYLHQHDNEVLICGRRADRLAQAAEELPGIQTQVCNVANRDDRLALYDYVQEHFPRMNMLINNAGIQCSIDLTKGVSELESRQNEILINLEAPIYLGTLFTPMLSGRENATIVNVTSGLAFTVEKAINTPVYTATKGGLHNFSIAQRHQLAPLGIRIVEVAPTALLTELNMERKSKEDSAMLAQLPKTDPFVEMVFTQMEQGEDDIRG